jgi:hypothetical protein
VQRTSRLTPACPSFPPPLRDRVRTGGIDRCRVQRYVPGGDQRSGSPFEGEAICLGQDLCPFPSKAFFDGFPSHFTMMVQFARDRQRNESRILELGQGPDSENVMLPISHRYKFGPRVHPNPYLTMFSASQPCFDQQVTSRIEIVRSCRPRESTSGDIILIFSPANQPSSRSAWPYATKTILLCYVKHRSAVLHSRSIIGWISGAVFCRKYVFALVLCATLGWYKQNNTLDKICHVKKSK